jgi:N-methylhydantoinase A
VSGSEDEVVSFAVGVDIGGTFTDCVVVSGDGALEVGKVATTPADRADGFFDSIGEAAAKFGLTLDELLARTERLVHGTTTGTNALVARTGARVGLLATAGHGDALFMMKAGGRSIGLPPEQLLDLAAGGPPAHYVDKTHVLEVIERVDSDGDVVVPLDEQQARAQVRDLMAKGVESIAVSLLWSIKNDAHERRLREIIGEEAPTVFVSCGSELAGRVGEYERTTTAVMNAYIGPLMVDYVARIEERARSLGYVGTVLFAQCAGGALTGEETRRTPILTLQSGPVSGVMCSVQFSEATDTPHIITTDMGGTTYDVSIIREKKPIMTDITIFERFEMALPMLDVASVGAGGGSVAWLDGSGRLNVGPQSAGAVPGPACYAQGGTEPTVTDADVALGIIDPDRFLHGSLKLDRGAAERAVSDLGRRLDLDMHQTAAGIVTLVDAKMAALIRRMSEYRGYDPRGFAMMAFGGGGPVHAGACARAAGVPRVVVALPEVAPVWSAAGAANADVVHVLTAPAHLDMPVDASQLGASLAALEERARQRLRADGFADGEMAVERFVKMRHKLQVYDVEVPVRGRVATGGDVRELDEQFTLIYEQRYGPNSGYRDGGVLVTGFVVRVVGLTGKAPLAMPTEVGLEGEELSRKVYWSELKALVDTPVLILESTAGRRRDETFTGPYLIQLPNTVVVVRPGQTAWFDDLGSIVMDTGMGTSARA